MRHYESSLRDQAAGALGPGLAQFAGWVLLAAALHASILFARWQFLKSGPTYSVAAAESVELSIVEAAPAGAEPAPPEPLPPEPPPPVVEMTPPPPPPVVVPEPTPPEPEPMPAPVLEAPKASPPPRKPPAPRPRSTTTTTTRPRATPPTTSSTRAINAGGSAGGSGAGNSKAAYLYNPHPRYPAASRQAREQGLVILLVSVNERGGVTSVSVRKSSGYPQLDQAARTGVSAWRFRPARIGGLPVSSQIEVPVQFRLAD